MKKTNYNKIKNIRVSDELLAVINSPKIQNGKMLQNDLKHSNYNQMVRYLIVKAYEEMYTKTWLNKMFDWDNIPEVQEYKFRQNGGHLMQKRREIDKLKADIATHSITRQESNEVDISSTEVSFNQWIVFKSGYGQLHKDIIVVDNFYADPDMVRNYAMYSLQYQPSGYHKGQRSQSKYILEGTKERLEQIMGRKIVNWNHPNYANGVFQFCTADQPIVYHVDSQQYAAMVYLTPNAPVETGTALYKSKVTGLRGFTKEERNEQGYYDTFKGLSADMNFYDKTQFEKVDDVGNVYNRLVIFNSSNLHAATGYFGDAIENARFFHLFFFDVE